MEDISVGVISLDLIIKNTISGQLEKIKNSIESSTDKIGENIQESIQKPIEKTAENMQKTFNSAFSGISNTAKKATENINKKISSIGDIPITSFERLNTEYENACKKSEFLHKKWEKLNDSDFTKKTAEKMLQLQQKIINTDKAVERLATELSKAQKLENNAFSGDYKVPEEPIERLKRQLELTNQKIKTTSIQWQMLRTELERTDDSQAIIKISDRLVQTENQLISLSNTADRYNQKINGFTSETTANVDSQFQEIFSQLKNFKIPTTPVERLEKELENTRIKSDLLKTEWEQLKNTDPTEKTVDKMLKLQQQILATDKSVEHLESELQKANSLENGVLTGEYQAPENPVERLQKQLELTNQKINAISSETTANVDSQIQEIFSRLKSFKIPTTPIERLKSELESTNTKVELLQKKWQELSNAEPSKRVTKQMLKIKRQIVSAQSKAENLKNKIADLGNSGHKLLTIQKVGKSAFNGLKAVGNQAIDSLRKRFGFLNKSAVSLTKPIEKLGRTLKNTFRRVFVMATLYAGVKAIKKSFADIMKSNDELAKSLNEVKANLSIAFTPIIQAVMPALNTLMSGLAKATKYIAGFIAGLFGMTYKQAADATKKLHDTGKTAEDTAKKATASLAGIDEMNILSDNSESSETDDDSEGIDYDSIDLSEPQLPDWAESLKNAIKNGDWYGVGEIFAERVNSIFGGVDWEKIEQDLNNKIKNVCDLFNGFIDNVDFSYIGDALAGGINTITSAINNLSNNIHWQKLGKGLAKGLNQAISKIKWQELGKSMSANIRILTNLLYGFVTEFDWEGLGDGIGEAVNGWFDGINFGKLGTTLSEGIKGIFETTTATLQTIDFGIIGEKIAGFVNNIDIVGILAEFASSVSGLISGILDLLISFIENTDWFKLGEQLFESLVEMIQNIDWTGLIERAVRLLGDVVGGASALLAGVLKKAWEALKKAWESVKKYFNEKIEECGGNVIKGVFKGIVDALKSVGKWIDEHIFKPFIEGFKKAFGIHSPSKEMSEMGGYIIDGLFNGISDGIKKVREIAEKVLNAIKKVFQNVGNWFKNKFSSAWDGVKNVWDDVKGYFSDIWTGIKETFSLVGDWFGEKFDGAWKNIKKAFSSMWTFFHDKWESVKSIFSDIGEWFSDKFGKAYENIKGAFSGIGEFFYGIWEDVSNKAKDGMNWLMGRVESGINTIIDGLNWFGFDLPDELGGGHVGFDISHVELPRLANGGLATAPTLAMVGDNKNARTDPEVIAPLSKLENMLGDNSEIAELLKIIIELLKNGVNIEIINYMFRNSREFSREVLKAVADDKARRGI